MQKRQRVGGVCLFVCLFKANDVICLSQKHGSFQSNWGHISTGKTTESCCFFNATSLNPVTKYDFLSSVQNRPDSHLQSPNQNNSAQLCLCDPWWQWPQRAHGVPRADSSSRCHIQDKSRQQPADECPWHRYLLCNYGWVGSGLLTS